VLTAALVGVLGVAIGAATGRQLAAIVISFAWLAFGEHAVGTWSSVRDYLPGHAIGDMLGVEGGGGKSFLPALLITGAYVAGLGALALVMTHRRDIT
jgi:hypothetical protein